MSINCKPRAQTLALCFVNTHSSVVLKYGVIGSCAKEAHAHWRCCLSVCLYQSAKTELALSLAFCIFKSNIVDDCSAYSKAILLMTAEWVCMQYAIYIYIYIYIYISFEQSLFSMLLSFSLTNTYHSLDLPPSHLYFYSFFILEATFLFRASS